jgi:raffinose/stachyose/melibiose transport system substrate-binding protein
MFSELGLSIPSTFAELVDTCEKIKSSEMVPFSFQSKSPLGMMQQSMTLLVSMPDYNGFLSDALSGSIGLNKRRDELERFGEKLLILHSYSQPDEMGTDYDQAINDFATGKSAMIIMGSFVKPTIEKANPDLDFAMFPVPGDTVESMYVCAYPGDFAFTVSSQAEHPIETKAFIEFLFDPQQAEYYARKVGQPMCVKGVNWVSPVFERNYEYILEGKWIKNPDAMWLHSVDNELRAAL